MSGNETFSFAYKRSLKTKAEPDHMGSSLAVAKFVAKKGGTKKWLPSAAVRNQHYKFLP